MRAMQRRPRMVSIVAVLAADGRNGMVVGKPLPMGLERMPIALPRVAYRLFARALETPPVRRPRR
ncbi:MAG: hypothetical protein ACREAQ_02035 [Nitrososphaera sp.]